MALRSSCSVEEAPGPTSLAIQWLSVRVLNVGEMRDTFIVQLGRIYTHAIPT
jgi:hypothetical protein